jgi:hypothetical protein
MQSTLSDLWPALVTLAIALLTVEWLLTVAPRRARRRQILTGPVTHG